MDEELKNTISPAEASDFNEQWLKYYNESRDPVNHWRPPISCEHPITINNPKKNFNAFKDPTRIIVPCGKCALCLCSKRRQWFFRLRKEVDHATSAYFITLTYNDACCPSSVNKRHCQLFVKRFRKRLERLCSIAGIERVRIKFFLVSEYGEHFGRPHYHVILFNYPLPCGTLRKHLAESWQQCDSFMFDMPEAVGAVTPASINYVCKYCLKNVQDEKDPNFMLCSKGIGSSFLTDATVRYYANNPVGTSALDGILYSLPRYYKDKLFTEEQKDAIRQKTQIYHEKRFREYLARFPNSDRRRVVDIWQQEQEQLSKHIRKQIDKLHIK